jgi:hypothetical protein
MIRPASGGGAAVVGHALANHGAAQRTQYQHGQAANAAENTDAGQGKRTFRLRAVRGGSLGSYQGGAYEDLSALRQNMSTESREFGSAPMVLSQTLSSKRLAVLLLERIQRDGTMIEFKGSHFEREVVMWGIRWYVAYPISYRRLQ